MWDTGLLPKPGLCYPAAMVLFLPIAVIVTATVAQMLWRKRARAKPMILPYSKQPMLTLKTLQALRKKASI